MPQPRPDAPFYDEVTATLAAKALRDLEAIMDRRNLLPLTAETRALIYDVTKNVVRQAISHAAEIHHVDGADISGAILKPLPPPDPPSPV